MEQKSLSAFERKKLGKGEAGRLRRAGKIPAIIYGSSAPKPVWIDAHEFDTKFHRISESTIIRLTVDSSLYEVLIRDFQEDAVSGKITHIDFYEVQKDKVLRTHVGVSLTGTAIGAKEGGLLETFVHELEVECLPRNLPEQIVLDIGALAIGHSIHVRDVPPWEGVRILNSPDQVICTILHKRMEEAPAAAAVPAEGEEAPVVEAAEAPAEE